MASGEAKFTFQPLFSKEYKALSNKDTQELLLKWSMKGRLLAQCYSFDQPFQAYQKNEFVTAFMQDPNVYKSLQVVSSNGKQVPLGTKADKVEVEQLSCSVLSMTFFDRLYEGAIARENGKLLQCFDEYYEDITIAHELRKMLLLEDSDHYDLYSDIEREEFLFCLFSHLCLGGQVCQFEDQVEPYLETTKMIYKDLVSVQKDPSSGDLHIASLVFKVTAQDDAGNTFYPSDKEHVQNFAYLIVDPLKRHVHILYHTFGSAAFDP